MTGPTRTLDPRTHAYRKDIADIGLAADIFAPHYARPTGRQLMQASEMVRAAPSATARSVSQLLRGETFWVVDEAAGWAWGRCGHDDYVGYLPSAALGVSETPTHRVDARLGLIFAEPDIKAPVVAHWPIGARFAAEEAGDFLRADMGYVHRRHAATISLIGSDPASVVERLLGMPYLWGGRGGGGIDCSGLVQHAFGLCGIAAPRDSDQQRECLGRLLAPDAPPMRGDLIFLPGHVAMMVDRERAIHANAHWMAVTIEPLADICARLGDSAILARRRVDI